MTMDKSVEQENETGEEKKQIFNGTVKINGSGFLKFSKKDLKKTIVGGLINAVGQALVWIPYWKGYIPSVEVVSILTFLSPVIIQFGRKLLADTREYEIITIEGDNDGEPESSAVTKL